MHLLLGLALSPLPALLTGWTEILRSIPSTVCIYVGYIEPMVWFWLTTYSVLPCLAYLAWSLPSMGRISLPKRSIVYLCLLAAYNPFRIYFYWFIKELEIREHITFQYFDAIILWDYRNFDTLVLFALAVWVFRRHRVMRPSERAVFHWSLFVCTLWAACDFFEALVFSFFLLEYAILIFGT